MLSLILAACAGSPFNGSYDSKKSFAKRRDSAPLLPLNPAYIRDAEPRPEVIKRAGNKSPYTVLGKTYRVMASSYNYKEDGYGSWYGTKFHGRNTSNGERYSLYEMTAAHKTLPIPCYVKVTNLENGLTAVVRVNDRGPFHEERIIDLSYAAATKLGYAAKGTARLRVEIINTDQAINKAAVNAPKKAAPMILNARYLQAGAFKSYQSALSFQKQLQAVLVNPVQIKPGTRALYRVHIGPVATTDIEQVKLAVKDAHLGIPHLVKRECEIVSAC